MRHLSIYFRNLSWNSVSNFIYLIFVGFQKYVEALIARFWDFGKSSEVMLHPNSPYLTSTSTPQNPNSNYFQMKDRSENHHLLTRLNLHFGGLIWHSSQDHIQSNLNYL